MILEKLAGLSDRHIFKVQRPGRSADGQREVTLGVLKEYVNQTQTVEWANVLNKPASFPTTSTDISDSTSTGRALLTAADAAAARNAAGATAGVWPAASLPAATSSTQGAVLLGGSTGTAAATVISLASDWSPDVINQGAASHSGTGSVSVVNQKRRFVTGATAGSRGGLTWLAMNGSGLIDGYINFGAAQKLVVRLATGPAVAAGQTLVRIALGNQGATTGALAAPGYSFELRAVAGPGWAVWGVHRNASTLTETDLGLTLGVSTGFHGQIISNGAGQVVYWVNGSVRATTSNGPTADTTGPVALYAEIFNGTEAASRSFDLANIRLVEL